MKEKLNIKFLNIVLFIQEHMIMLLLNNGMKN